MEKYRVILRQTHDAFMNMAFEEAVMNSVRNGNSLPTIRFFSWEPSAVSIGYFQGIHNEVNLEKLKEEGIDIVRRITGGGAVYHDNKGELTYSIIAPERFFPKDVVKSYEVICGYIIKALKDMGIDAIFKPINDVMVMGSKISGSAQTRKDGILLQHGTLLINTDPKFVFSLLKGRIEKNKYTKSNKKPITSINELSPKSVDEVQDLLKEAFTNDKEYLIGKFTKEEIIQAKELCKNKYQTKEWIYQR